MSLETMDIDQIHVTADKHPGKVGKSILFVHGAWHGSWCWKPWFIPFFFSKGYNCYALDLRAHGQSEPKTDRKMRCISLDDYIEDLRKVVEALPEKEITLVGHSMGGMIVQKFLEERPTKISNAILLAPATPGGVLSTSLYTMTHLPIIYLQIMLSLSLRPMIKYFKVVKKIFFYSETDEKKLRDYHSKMQNESFRAVLLNMLFGKINYEKIKTRTLIIAAENDIVFPLKQMHKLQNRLHCDLKVFTNTGHDIMLEQNWEQAADTIDLFIQSG